MEVAPPTDTLYNSAATSLGFGNIAAEDDWVGIVFLIPVRTTGWRWVFFKNSIYTLGFLQKVSLKKCIIEKKARSNPKWIMNSLGRNKF